jgi:HK97 gp10 family phage protein
LLRQLRQLQNSVQARAVRNALGAAARIVAKRARQTIPVGTQAHRTYRGVLVAPGFARRSVVVRTSINRRTGRITAVVGVRAQAFYATQFVELERGNSSRTGRPWLRPAFEETQPQQIAAIDRALARAILRAVKNAG